MPDTLPAPREVQPSRGVYSFWRDPVCVGSWALYVVNRFLLIRHFGAHLPFLYEHFDDTLFLPAALPPYLWMRERLGLRGTRGAPTWREVIITTALCSVLLEGLGPRFIPQSWHASVGDWGDVAAYWVGALVAGAWWNRRYFLRART